MVLHYIKVSLDINLCSLETRHKSVELGSSPRMRLRIEEMLAIPDIHRRRFDEVIHGQLIEILFGPQHFHSAIVRIEECRDLVGWRLYISFGCSKVWKVRFSLWIVEECCSLAEVPSQLWRHRPFDMDVELDFGNSADERAIHSWSEFFTSLMSRH